MRNLDQNTVTESALERISNCLNPRLKEVMTALIRHLHEFAREVKLTPEEWMKGIQFLTDVGHITDEKRQEFILLSDTLGLSALVDLLANRGKSEAATESSLLGPFFREGAPRDARRCEHCARYRGRPAGRSRLRHFDRRKAAQRGAD